jgi:diguanylate cyclase (GGDEF)-like protein
MTSTVVGSGPSAIGAASVSSAEASSFTLQFDLTVAQAFAALREAVIMMVDDDPILVEVVKTTLEDGGYTNFISTTNPEEAMGKLQEVRPDVLFLDMVMPGLSGLEILQRLRNDRALVNTPVIVLTASVDPKVRLQALDLGASDFLAKPVDPSELALRLRNTLAAKAYQDRLAYYDLVTGLPNRRMFMERLEFACKLAQRYDMRGALLHINMDRFKQINEAFGPRVGDMLLKEIGGRFSACIRDSDAIARQGKGGSIPSLSRLAGDEFTVLLPNIDHGENAAAVAQRLLYALHDAPFHNGDQEVFLTASIGVAVFPDDGEDQDAVLKNAGTALREAKDDGRRQFKFYSKEFNARAMQRVSLESGLRRALERDELRLNFQPKVDTRTQTLRGAEALVRWQHPERGLVSPMDFIPVAEASGLIVPLGKWVLLAACRQAAAWRDAGLDTVQLSVNVSAIQFRDPDFIDMIARTLRETRLAPSALCVELTETVVLDRSTTTTATLVRLHELGIKLSIDDFGAGFTSLSLLKSSPFDELKVDKSFVDGIESDANSAAIVAAVIALAHNLGLSVVAEGVETQGQHAFLQAKECDECQGYLFSRPVDADAFEALLGQARASRPALRAVG